MDSIFQIGFPELIAILILAGLVMGPQRIRQVALYLGRLSARVQAISRQFTRQLNAELDAAERGELKTAISDLQTLKQEMQELRREITQAPRVLRQNGEAVLRPTTTTAARIRPNIPPPPPASETETGPDYHENRILPPAKDLEISPNALAGVQARALPQVVEIPEDPDA